MKPRKFSFDIPRLKIGPSKSDTKALRDHLASSQLDSPPPTPKSVRPPLSPHQEVELRSACAYIVQNFKPSHIVYEEQHGAKQQLDYAAIKSSAQVEKPDVTSPPLPLSKVVTKAPNRASANLDGEDDELPVSPSEKFRYKPDTATEDLFKEDNGSRVPIPVPGSRNAILRAEQLMSGPQPPAMTTTLPSSSPAGRSRAASGRSRADSHLRSVSSPMPQTQTSLAAPANTEVVERPRTAPRADSVETSNSTPQTDATDYPWSEKASTAMTSAAPTPARSSKRTSSQALQQPGSEGSSVPNVEAMDADWMRVELEKHKKAQEERLQQKQEQERADEEAARAAETTPTQMSTHAVTTPSGVAVKMPTRKPVPAPSATRASSRQATSRSESRQEERSSAEEQPRAASRQASSKETPRVDSMQDQPPVQQSLPPRSDSRAGARSFPQRSSSRSARSRARSITQQVKNYVRPSTSESTAQRTVRPEDASPPSEEARQPRSSSRAGGARDRAESVTRQVKDYFRPVATAMSSRKPSVDLGRSESRSRSIDSFQSAVSEAAQSTASSNTKWRTWKPSLHRRDGSHSSAANLDSSRPGTSGSTTENRGRATSRERQDPSSQRKTAKPINLNRELPPLPGLDKWKDEEVKRKPPPTYQPTGMISGTALKSPTKSHSSQRSRHERAATVGSEPNIGERDEILAARMGSPSSSRKASMDVRRQPPPHPTEPPPPPPPVYMSANFSCASDFDYEHLTPTPSEEDNPLEARSSSEVKSERRRSRSIQAAYPSDLEEKVKSGSLGQSNPADKPSALRPVFAGKAQKVNYSRVAGGPINGGLSRNVSKAGHVGLRKQGAATTAHTPVAHSRNPSSSFSRKMSMQDDYARMHDGQFSNVVEISATTPPLPTMSKNEKERVAKAKWWQRGGGGTGGKERKLPASWMDQVIKSGSRSGVLLTDEVAGAPIVRY